MIIDVIKGRFRVNVRSGLEVGTWLLLEIEGWGNKILPLEYARPTECNAYSTTTTLCKTRENILGDYFVNLTYLILVPSDTFLGYVLQIVNVYVSEDVIIPDSSAQSILYQLAVIGEGLTATDNGAMINKMK